MNKSLAALQRETAFTLGLHDSIFAHVVRRPQVAAFDFETAPMPPKAPSTYAVPKPEEVIAKAEADIAKAQEQIEAANVKAALADRFNYDQELAQATVSLIGEAKRLILDGQTSASANTSFAKFRKQLSPLAATYGVKIVLVGNKSTATVALA